MPRSGAEQSGRRPAIVVSQNGFNEAANWRSIIVVAITTSSAQLRHWRTAIRLPAGADSLVSDSIALCRQVITLERSKLMVRIGEMSPNLMAQVRDELKVALSFY